MIRDLSGRNGHVGLWIQKSIRKLSDIVSSNPNKSPSEFFEELQDNSRGKGPHGLLALFLASYLPQCSQTVRAADSGPHTPPLFPRYSEVGPEVTRTILAGRSSMHGFLGNIEGGVERCFGKIWGNIDQMSIYSLHLCTDMRGVLQPKGM